MNKKMATLEERFNKLKEVMVNNLETLHDMLMDQMDESEEYYDMFEKTYNGMIQAVEEI